jgi:hypothetical protein
MQRRQDIVRLAELSMLTNVTTNIDKTTTDANMFCNHFQRVFAEKQDTNHQLYW